MQSKLMSWKMLLILFMLYPIVGISPCAAKVYKYKGEDGVWHFSDTPPPGYQEDLENENVQATGPLDISGLPDLEARLVKQLNPRGEIESARLATLVVQSPIGYGSGFFISKNGYIVTNKHVIRTSADDEERKKQIYAETEVQIEEAEKRIQMEAESLTKHKRDLDDFKAYIERQPESAARRLNQQRYETKLAEYQFWEKDFHQRKRKFQEKRDRVLWEQSQARRMDSLAYLNQNFTIIIADNTEHYAYLVAVSKRLDLALLKLDGFKTPVLKPVSQRLLTTGDQVYAIGNPVSLRNSVTSGILSGIEGDFAKTNAQIYPGNSGGPLITPNGEVIGVNTFKKLTRKFEGLGFAVLIDRVFEEFGAHIDR